MAFVDLATLRELARLYSDSRQSSSRKSGFLPDASVNSLINLALGEHYDLLVQAGGHERYAAETTLTATGSAVLPLSCNRLISLHVRWAADGLEEIGDINNLGDRHRLTNHGTFSQGSAKAYRLSPSGSVELFPTPPAGTLIVARYVPEFQPLTADTGANGGRFEFQNGWERMVALRVACEMRMIQQLPYGDLMSLYQQDRQRIEELAAERSASPARIRDVNPEGPADMWPFDLPRATL